MNTQEQVRKPILCVLVINRHELLSLPHFLLLLTSDTFNVANYWKLRGMMKKTLIFKFFFSTHIANSNNNAPGTRLHASLQSRQFLLLPIT